MADKPKRKKPSTNLAEILTQTMGSNRHNCGLVDGIDWQPTETQWAWYVLWSTRMKSILAIAKMAGVAHSTVYEAVHRVRAWAFRVTTAERIEMAERQTEALLMIYDQAMVEFERSKEVGITKTTKSHKVMDEDFEEHDAEETTIKEEFHPGDPALLAAAMKALADIRDIWGVNAPKEIKQQIDTRFEGLVQITADTEEEAIRQQAMAMLEESAGNPN